MILMTDLSFKILKFERPEKMGDTASLFFFFLEVLDRTLDNMFMISEGNN